MCEPVVTPDVTLLLPEERRLGGTRDAPATVDAYGGIMPTSTRAEKELTRWLRRRPFVVDSLLAVVLAAVSVPGLFVTTDYLAVDTRDADLLGVLITLATCLPVAWRRRMPVAAFAASLVPSIALASLGYVQGLSGVPVLITLYTVAVCRGRRASFVCLLGSVVGTVLVLSTDALPDNPADYVATMAIFAAAWALGRSMRLRRAHVAGLEARARQLQATRDADTRAALAEERGRIARELHDVVAHHVSVMTVQASAAQRTIDRDPVRAREAMAAVEHTGRGALAEMRRIVGVLRSDAEDSAEAGPVGLVPQPCLADLTVLIDQVREAGLDVRLRVVGEPRPLETGVDLSAFRIVQEALTNTLKHAGPSRADVTVSYGATSVDVVVTDDGRGAAAALQSGGDGGTGRTGHGLLGMRERVGLYGGRLRVGPRRGGGFEVRASFPLAQGTT